jgi:hypothetical protein
MFVGHFRATTAQFVLVTILDIPDHGGAVSARNPRILTPKTAYDSTSEPCQDI